MPPKLKPKSSPAFSNNNEKIRPSVVADDDDDDDDEQQHIQQIPLHAKHATSSVKTTTTTRPVPIIRISPESLAVACGMWNGSYGPQQPSVPSALQHLPHTSIAIIDVRGSDLPKWGRIPCSVNVPCAFISTASLLALCAAAAQLNIRALVFHCLHSRNRAVFSVDMLARLIESASRQGSNNNDPVASVTAAAATGSSSSSKKADDSPWNHVDTWKIALQNRHQDFSSEQILTAGAASPATSSAAPQTTTAAAATAEPQQHQAFAWPVVAIMEGGFKAWLERWKWCAPHLCVGAPAAKLAAGTSAPARAIVAGRQKAALAASVVAARGLARNQK